MTDKSGLFIPSPGGSGGPTVDNTLPGDLPDNSTSSGNVTVPDNTTISGGPTTIETTSGNTTSGNTTDGSIECCDYYEKGAGYEFSLCDGVGAIIRPELIGG